MADDARSPLADHAQQAAQDRLWRPPTDDSVVGQDLTVDRPINDAVDARRATFGDQGDTLTQGRQAQDRRVSRHLRRHPGCCTEPSNPACDQGFEIPPPLSRQQQPALKNLTPAHTVSRNQNIIRRQGGQQVLSPSPIAVKAAAGGAPRNEGDIQAAARQGVEVLVRAAFSHFEGEMGDLNQQPAKQVIQRARPERGQDADAQGVFVRARQVGDLIHRSVELDHRPVCALHEVASRRRQLHTRGATLEDPRAEPVLEFLNAARHRRLLDAQAPRGPSKPAAFGRRQDVAHLVEAKAGPGRRLARRRIECKRAGDAGGHEISSRHGHRRPPVQASPPRCASPLYTSNIATISSDLADPAGLDLELHGDLPYIFGVPEDMAMAIATSPAATPREPRKERIELRVAASAKDLIQRAMAVSGLTAGDLAYEGARRVLDEHERMVLTGADSRAFLDALMDPPAPNDKLVAAFRRHQAEVG